MKKEDLRFTVLFVIGIVMFLLLLGTSITGYFVQSMYCEEGECKQFCDYITDCADKTKICCDKGGFGVCEDPIICEASYEFSPQAEMNLDFDIKEPTMQRAEQIQISKGKIWLYLILLTLTVAIGIMYFLKK